METKQIELKLQTLALRGATGIATRGELSGSVYRLTGTQVLPARQVYDTVTGQVVTVVGSGVLHLNPLQIKQR